MAYAVSTISQTTRLSSTWLKRNFIQYYGNDYIWPGMESLPNLRMSVIILYQKVSWLTEMRFFQFAYTCHVTATKNTTEYSFEIFLSIYR